MSRTATTGTARASGFRWLQLVIGIACMVMIANLQYGWTLFVLPIDAKYHWGRAAIQVAFSIFVLTETWLVPVGLVCRPLRPQDRRPDRRRPGRHRLGHERLCRLTRASLHRRRDRRDRR